ncbi:26S proteasome non-ATPase regulatory subunit [Nesidiocoris tenuis]|uniref:26S proteasome non-ATPase regulatory subunit 4 n=1 Tax=Nesidiocoris tenuis TaxID=355587 RepID=A0ABN7B3C2_9HEMI|nr:26S proteasome non-ATPase regulatory subunit [Nesidiocoris tenuis]
MVLESTMICVDNSDYMRNGDFLPTRLQAQQDAVNLVCHSKTRSNPENNVGLLTLANVEVLATLTTDVGRILSKLHQVSPNGNISLLTGIRIAHLALKHRQGKNHKMRIVAFVGSPIGMDDKELVKLAKRLKKEKVNVDIVSFGEEAENNELLTTFINTLNGKEGGSSHLVTVPPGPHLSDALISSPVIQGEDGAGGAGLGGAGFEFGVDPNEDPELALALRVSMEEQRQRQDAMNSAAGGSAATESATGGTPKAEGVTTAAAAGQDTGEMAMLERALAMSLDAQPAASEGQAARRNHDFSNMTEEEQIAFAIQMSMQESEGGAAAAKKDQPPEEKMETDDAAADDPAYVRSVLENLPGVDPGADDATKTRRDAKK